MAADAGCEAVGVDIASSAIRLARAKASMRGSSARCIVGDALNLALLGQQFDVVLDCGRFHLLDDEDRAPFETGELAPAGRPSRQNVARASFRQTKSVELAPAGGWAKRCGRIVSQLAHPHT